MPALVPAQRRIYDLTSQQVPGPVEPIPLLLYQRQDLPGPKPVVLYYHGVVQSKETYIDTLPLARRLADAGMLVVVPDAPGHGERVSGATLRERLRQSLAHEFCADIEQAADEAPAILDWLAVQPAFDGTHLAVVGISMGGFTAAVIAARLRKRLSAAVCIAGCADLPRCMAETDSIGPNKWGPLDRALDAETVERISRIDPLGYPERFAPLPLLLLHGEKDTWNPCITSERFAALLRPTYASAPTHLRLVIVTDAPHWPPSPTMIQEAVAWLRAYFASGSARPATASTFS